MCEYVLGGLIAGFVNVGPGKYVIQSINDVQEMQECVILIPDQKNDKNVSALFTL